MKGREDREPILEPAERPGAGKGNAGQQHHWHYWRSRWPNGGICQQKPDSWMGTLLGLLPWGTGIISAGLLLGWCHKDKKRLLLPMILSTVGCAVGAEQAAVQAAAVWQAARHMPEIPMPGAMLRTAAANAFSTGLWFSAATLVWSLAVLFRRRAS